MPIKSLLDIKPLPQIADLAKDLLSDSDSVSKEAGLKLAKDANDYGLTVKNYVILAGAEQTDHKEGINAFDKLLAELNLPLKNDYQSGIHLQAASETFNTYPGTRALLPEVIDEVLRWQNRQPSVENVESIVSNSRTMAGNELLSTVVDDDSAERDTFEISEGARIPVRSIKTSQQTVKIFKIGSGIRTTYEFNRRASIEILIPYMARIMRELEKSKVALVTSLLINGDGVYGAAPVILQSSYNSATGATAVDGKINWKHFLYWVMQRAKSETPIDTVLMNWDGFFQWMLLFGANETEAGDTPSEILGRTGVNIGSTPSGLAAAMAITPVLSTTMSVGKLLGFTKAETVEELVEANSDIQETDNSINNQTITVYKTENVGYRLVFGDTRSIFDFDEA